MAKLNVKQLEAIRDSDPEKVTRAQLAEKYGVSVSRIAEILRGPKNNPHFPKGLLPGAGEKKSRPSKKPAGKAPKKSAPKAAKKDERPVARPSETA